jgi:hypothetical protein
MLICYKIGLCAISKRLLSNYLHSLLMVILLLITATTTIFHTLAFGVVFLEFLRTKPCRYYRMFLISHPTKISHGMLQLRQVSPSNHLIMRRLKCMIRRGLRGELQSEQTAIFLKMYSPIYWPDRLPFH